MRCLWCAGNLYQASNMPHIGGPGLMCHHCGRSGDLRYELYVIVEQMKEHHNWHTYGVDREYRNCKRRGLPLMGKRGRRNKWT